MATYKDVLMLVDKVSAPLKDIQKNTDKTNKKIDTMRDKLGRVGNNMKAFGSKIAAFGKMAVGVFAAVAAAIIAVSSAVIKTANKYAEMGDRIDKMSQKIGMSRKAFQEWDYIMSQNGGNVESLQMGFKTLVTQIEGVQKGSKDSIKAFKKLGVQVKDNNGKLRTADDIFNDTVRALQKMKNPTEKMILANRLFGRSASELRPLLNQSAESVDNLREKANELGLIISDEDIKNAVEYKDTMDTFSRYFEAKFGSSIMKIMPDISKGMEDIIKITKTKEMQTILDNFSTSIKWIVSKGLPAIINAISWITKSIFWLLTEPPSLLAGMVNDAKDKMVYTFKKGITQIKVFIIKLKQTTSDMINSVVSFINSVFVKISEWIDKIIQKIVWVAGKLPGLNKIVNGSKILQQQTNNNVTNNTSTVNNYGNTTNYGGMFPYQGALLPSPF